MHETLPVKYKLKSQNSTALKVTSISHFNAVLFCEVILALCNSGIVSVDF
ncbi:hypothetical protein AB3F25_04940 [Aggregatibacter sp. HMT-949]